MTTIRVSLLSLVLAGGALAAVISPPAEKSASSAGRTVEELNGRLTIDVTDCPVAEFLQILSGEIGCELYTDPGIESRISMKVKNLDPEKALMKALSSVNYMITWRTELDPKGRRIDRIESIAVYREGHRDEVVRVAVVRAPGWKTAGTVKPALDEKTLETLRVTLANKADPARAGEAARILAENGSPAALRLLFGAVAEWDTDGELADPVSKAALGITDRNAMKALLAEYLAQDNESVELASRFALGKMADTALLDALRQAYAAAKTDDERDKVVSLLGSISSKDAENGLTAIAAKTSLSPDELREAALAALANMGTATATDQLLMHLETSGPEEADELAALVRNVVASQTSVAALRYAAAGNKRFSSDKTRVAAIQALGRFQDSQSRALLDSLARDANPAIRAAASSVLKGAAADVDDDEDEDED